MTYVSGDMLSYRLCQDNVNRNSTQTTCYLKLMKNKENTMRHTLSNGKISIKGENIELQ